MPDVGPALIAGRYQLEELIGRGAMAEVWRGVDHRLDMPVAVKILNPLVAGVSAADRFAREARAAAQIMHRNVVTVLDIGLEGSRRFLVMELLTGRNLAAELAVRSRLPVGEACALLAQAAAGLAAAHRVGVVHRDIKPANLHLAGDGTLKVVDFGLAHIASEAARLTAVGTFVGTAAYLAPEQIDGSGGQAACDLYALGCVAYELLCGQPPFTGSAPELIHQHVHRAPARPSSHRPDIPAELERLIGAMLAKKPAERPAGAEQVGQVLAAIAHSARGVRPAWRPAPAAQVPPPGTARVGDTTVLEVPRPGPAATSAQGRRPLVRLAVALGAVVVVPLGAVAVFSDSEDETAAPVPSATATVHESTRPAPSATPTATVAAKLTTSPTPTPASPPSRSAEQDPRVWLIAFDRAVSAQQSRGGIDRDLARKAHRKIREAGEKLSEGKVRESREEIQELVRDLSEARRERRLAPGPLTTFLTGSLKAVQDDRGRSRDDDDDDDDDDE
ncbi:serine/threonine-protein kinase [Microtetraspora sp. NBRC 13810]|uniref:serine/threonine-protein kinase n=1 Tax=Microtetraspora sp. NBRC 13810 TaxID=3030990 RepID=UPI002556566C|nr:serine/threonine-protein kinase [Microtetraspora sp. NBRC 13810]